MRSASTTIADIAAQAGVSKMTVSKVINNRPGISEATRQRVLHLVEQLGYTAHPTARALAAGRTNTLGVIVPSLEQQYLSEVIRGADLSAHAAGINLLISTTLENTAQERLNVARFRNLVDGLLMVLPRSLARYADGLRETQVPVVVVAAASGDVPFPLVDADHQAGADAATTYLLSLGHRRIAFLKGRDDTAASLQRRQGHHAALRRAGLRPDPTLERHAGFTQPGGFRAAQSLLDLQTPPTAIFAANDLSAFGAIEAVRDRGLRVPQDISVIGFDDIPQASQIHPPLTTVRQPLIEMGTAGTDLLLTLLGGQPVPSERLIMPTELVVRASTGPVPP